MPSYTKTKPTPPIFAQLPTSMPVWMSHSDQIVELPPGFRSLAYTDSSPMAAIGNGGNILGLQFHPEVVHTANGKTILENFLFSVCNCDAKWTPDNFIDKSVQAVRDQVGSGKVICALSGGVDSAVTAALIHEAIGNQLTSIFVNNGLMRREEPERVLDTFRNRLKLNMLYVDASERFLRRLEGVVDPEQKRHIVGEEFIRVFEESAAELGDTEYLAQGTLYPDVIESQTPENRASAKIKTHHNVGGLPEHMTLKLVEPLRDLFKDEVREVGLALGLPPEVVYRQPFPGPGLAIRVMGEVTAEKLEMLRACDWGCHRRNQGLQPVPPTLADLCRAYRHPERRRHGRLSRLWPCRCHTCRHQRGRYDRRLGASALRGAGAHLQPYRQRGTGRHTRGLRRDKQATRYD